MENKLKEARFFAKKSQDQLHIETGLSQSKISRIENGYIRPSEEDKKLVAQALKEPVSKIFPE
jgi:transcriptional regulator with XRE-family HTH domain